MSRQDSHGLQPGAPPNELRDEVVPKRVERALANAYVRLVLLETTKDTLTLRGSTILIDQDAQSGWLVLHGGLKTLLELASEGHDALATVLWRKGNLFGERTPDQKAPTYEVDIAHFQSPDLAHAKPRKPRQRDGETEPSRCREHLLELLT